MKFGIHALLTLNLLNASTTTAFVPGSSISFASHSSSSSGSLVEATRKIGIFGGGTVGGGIVEILGQKKEHLVQLTGGTDIEICKICVRDASKSRDFDVPAGTEIVTDYDAILEDEEIDMVVEVMGGTTDAKEVVYKAIEKKKDIVTANKALIAACLPEIEEKLSSSSVQFRYEAAVCGGIPIIRSMQSDFVGDEVTMLSGIINGCTNFMLTAMDRDGKSYEDALKEASELGYAEADPTLDVGGFDARSKLKILMRMAYGIDVEEDDISCKGITGLTKADFKYAKMLGGTIKLIGVAKLTDDGKKVAAFVSPCYLTQDDTLASVAGATNAIEVMSSNLQSSTYIGQGAGRFPTANSCVNDIVSLAKGDMNAIPFNPLNEDIAFSNDFEAMFYLRLKYRDQVGITRQCGETCEKYGVSIYSLLQTPKDGEDDAFAIITEKVKFSDVKKACADLEGYDWCKGNAYLMPVLREDKVHGPRS